jgi:hypothetical protein
MDIFQILRALDTYFLYVEFSDFYINHSLAGQTTANYRDNVFVVKVAQSFVSI